MASNGQKEHRTARNRLKNFYGLASATDEVKQGPVPVEKSLPASNPLNLSTIQSS